jgi:anthranilate synthase component 1
MIKVKPEYNDFERNARGGLSSISMEIPADLETPVSAYLKLRPLGANVLLESIVRGERVGRYSMIGVGALLRLTVEKGKCRITNCAWEEEFAVSKLGGPLEVMRYLSEKVKLDSVDDDIPFLTGAIGYLSYDIVRSFEKLPDHSREDTGFPEMHLEIPESVVVFDHAKRREEFEEMVRKGKEYIRAGDIFQVVLSQRLEGESEAEPIQIYRALRMLNPSPYMFYFDWGSCQMIGSSPEALVTLNDGTAMVRPIAGTRPRGATPDEDAQLTQELTNDVKEKAEHIMLVDLGRNDLGRVCEFGSVKVTDLMKVEYYSHVMHMVSTVEGRLAKDRDMFDLLRAAFPAGTVTGAPKIRAMEIIEELEKARRGPYAGSVGYFDLRGNMDLCITIRTIVIKDHRYYLQAGAGIVFDSDPYREYRETLDKLGALARAIEIAEEGFR